MSNKSLFGTNYQQRPDSGGPSSLRQVLTKTASELAGFMDRRLKEIDGLNRAATDNAARAADARTAAEDAARLATAALTDAALAQTAAEAARQTAIDQATEAQIAANEAEQASEQAQAAEKAAKIGSRRTSRKVHK